MVVANAFYIMLFFYFSCLNSDDLNVAAIGNLSTATFGVAAV
jgi:hypothetical protein